MRAQITAWVDAQLDRFARKVADALLDRLCDTIPLTGDLFDAIFGRNDPPREP